MSNKARRRRGNCALAAMCFCYLSATLHFATVVIAEEGSFRGEGKKSAAVIADLALLRRHINVEYSELVQKLAQTYGQSHWVPTPREWAATADANATHHIRTLIVPIKFQDDYRSLLWIAAAAAASKRHGTDAKIVALVDDLHWYNPAVAYAEQNDALDAADIVFANYATLLPVLYPSLIRSSKRVDEISDRLANAKPHEREHRIAWLPHASSADFFVRPRPPCFSKKQVMLSGATTKEWYPYRHVIDTWIGTNGKQLKDKRQGVTGIFARLQHPVYGSKPGIPAPAVGKRYALRLNEYAACITDGLHLNYTIAKLFEIPAAGCLLLVNAELRPLMAGLGMFDAVHYLAYRRGGGRASTKKHLRNLVQMLLDPQNAQHVANVRRRAQNLVMRRHMVGHRVAQVDASLFSK